MSALVGAGLSALQEMQLEEEVSRSPYTLRAWISYLNFAKDAAAPVTRYIIYERALSYLPRSYKLWFAYLQDRERSLQYRCASKPDKKFDTLVGIYERALVHMNKMPRIWLDYCRLLIRMNRGTQTRRVFDRALMALPVTQHKQIWDLYIQWAKDFGVQETTVRVFRRYMMFDSSNREQYVDFLIDSGYYEEAARQLSICVDDEHFVSPSGRSKHQMWMLLCKICAHHPEETSRAIDVEAVIRSGISKFSDEVGKLWCRLADFYIKQGNFEKARDVFEEAISSVVTVRDFSVVFDTYINVEESIVTEKMRILEEMEAEGRSAGGAGGDGEVSSEAVALETADIDVRLARLEYIMDQRPLLVNSVVLRQNPHNIHEWLKRAKLYKEEPQKKVMALVEAIKTVDPKLASGKFSNLWLALAEHYEQLNDAENARAVYRKASDVNFKSVDELANIYCAWGEFELKVKQYSTALSVMQQAVKEPAMSARRRAALAAAQGRGQGEDHAEGLTAADKLYKNAKVWRLYLDLEENLGTVETCRAAYERVLELKVITAQMLLNYADFLEKNNFFEDSFRVYERGVEIFMFPQVKAIWVKYIDAFIQRYGSSKLERLRDIFEQSVANAPSSDIAELYLKYAKTEESFGMIRQAMAVYDRASRLVPAAEKLNMYRLYIRKVEINYGITKTRPIYDRAVAELREEMSKSICLDYAAMERKLGEIDRARAIFAHGSQFADPRRDKQYWRAWREFEEVHGNVDTFKDMLRVQRSVEVAFSHVNYLTAELTAGETIAEGTKSGLDAIAKRAEEEALENAKNIGIKRSFVAASASSNEIKNSMANAGSAAAYMRDEDVGEDGEGDRERGFPMSTGDSEGEGEKEEEEEEEEDIGFKEKPLPEAILGGLK